MELRIRASQPIQQFIEPPQPIESNQPQIDGVQQIALSNFQDSVNAVTTGNQLNSRLLNQIAESTIGIQRATALTEDLENVRNTGNADAAIRLVTEGLGIYQGIQEARQKVEEANKVEAQSRARIALEEEKQLFLGEAENVLRDVNLGRSEYTTRAREFIQRYSSVLPPEDVIKLTAELFEPYRDFSSEESRAAFGTLNQIHNHQVNVKEAELGIQFAQRAIQIANSNDIDEINALTAQSIEELNNSLIGLSPYQRLAITDSVLETIGEQYQDKLGQLGSYVNHLRSIQAYDNDNIRYVQPLIDAGDLAAAEEARRRLAVFHGVSLSESQIDPLRSLQLQDRQQKLQQNRDNAYREGLIDQARLIQGDNAQIADLAFVLFNDPVAAAGFDPVFKDNSPMFRQAEVLAESLAYVQQEGRDVNLELSRLNEQIARLETANFQTIESEISGAQGLDSMLATLSIASQFDDSLRGILGDYASARDSVDPAQKQAAIQDVLDSRSTIMGVLQNRALLLQEEYNQRAEILRRYEIYTPEDLAARAASSVETINFINDEIQQGRQRVRGNLTQEPSFKLPALETISMGPGGQEALLPFKSGVTWRQTGAVADPRHNGPHAGADFGVPEGTPLVFYTQGTVTAVNDHGSGYGRYIDIRSPDGYLHRFAHLSDQQVSVGQQVFPGQVIGLSGNTGTGTGPHLHWEVRLPNAPEFSRWDPNYLVDPMEYTAQFTQPTQQVIENEQFRQIMSIQNNMAPVEESGNTYASINASDYQDNPDHNFGYEQLANNASFRTKLHQVSNNLGFPTQWLADVIAFESRFQHDVWNRGGHPAVGLIQFYADEGRSASRATATKTLGGVKYRLQDIANMNPVEQLDLVQQYLEDNKPSGGYQSPYEVLGTIFGGPGLLRSLRNDPQNAGSSSDGFIAFGDYMRRLGEHVGRQYQPLRPEPIRTR